MKAVTILDDLIKECNHTSRSKGWWDDENPISDGPKKIALMHSELSEALEAMRLNNFTEKDGVTEELADVIIRIFDYAGQADLPLADTILDKMAKNKDRPHRHGGKAF